MGYTSTRRLFPVGLWVTLFVAAVALVVPRPFARVESTLAAVVSWPLQPWASLRGDDVQPERLDGADASNHWTPLGDHLSAEAVGVPVAVRRDFGAAPIACRVVGLAGRRGGRFTELVLDRTWDEVRRVSPHVTSAGVLVGVMGRRGRGSSRDDMPTDLARVLLLHHRDATPVPAALIHPQGRLRCIVEPSRAGAMLPLQTEIWDDPYAAARLVGSGSLVLTEDLAADVERNAAFGVGIAEASFSSGETSTTRGELSDGMELVGTDAWLPRGLPGGLVLGRLAVWGYEEQGRTLPIGLYVQPALEPFNITAVSLWRGTDDSAAEELLLPLEARGTMVQAALVRLPTPHGPCWLLVGKEALPDGGALLVDGLFVGPARALGGSRGLAVPLEQRREAFSFTLWPDGDGAGKTFRALVTPADAAFAELRGAGDVTHDPRAPLQPLRVTASEGPRLDLVAGWLTTGVQTTDPLSARHAPPGLLIGRAVPVPGQPGALYVDRVPHPSQRMRADGEPPEVIVYRFDPVRGER